MLVCADRPVMVGPDDKIITGLGAVVTRFADGLPVVTEHEWRPRLIEPSSGRRDAAPRYLGLRRPAARRARPGPPRCTPSPMVPLGRPGRRPGKRHAGRCRL